MLEFGWEWQMCGSSFPELSLASAHLCSNYTGIWKLLYTMCALCCWDMGQSHKPITSASCLVLCNKPTWRDQPRGILISYALIGLTHREAICGGSVLCVLDTGQSHLEREKIPPTDWLGGKPSGTFPTWLIWEGPACCAWCHPWACGHGW